MDLDISLDLYKIFCTVVKTGNMSLAAKELYISQPAVSMSVKQLEDKLGKPLLIRSPKGIRPTAEGSVIYEYVSQALNLITSAQNKYFEMSGLKTGDVRIGASDTLLNHYLLPYIEKFIGEYSYINIKITNRTTYETIELLKSGHVDIGFVNLPIKSDDYLEVRECMPIQDCLISGTKFKHLEKKGIHINQLHNYPLLLLENESNSRKYINQYAQSNGIELKPNIELGSFDLLMKFAMINIGIVIGVREFSRKEIANKELFEIPLTPPIKPRSIGLVKLRGVALSFAADKFMEFLNI